MAPVSQGLKNEKFGLVYRCKLKSNFHARSGALHKFTKCFVFLCTGSSLLDHQLQIPSCENILTNLTVGRWIEQTSHDLKIRKQKLDVMLQDFRVQHEGFNFVPP